MLYLFEREPIFPAYVGCVRLHIGGIGSRACPGKVDRLFRGRTCSTPFYWSDFEAVCCEHEIWHRSTSHDWQWTM
jgi:hypothetical protein